MRKYGEVLDYRTIDKAGEGKKYVFGNLLRYISERPEQLEVMELERVDRDVSFVFFAKGSDGKGAFQFCREAIEEEVLMTNRQLAEWLERKNGEHSYTDSPHVFHHWPYLKGDENEPIQSNVRIRSWDSCEWVVPTLEIYERDCKGAK